MTTNAVAGLLMATALSFAPLSPLSTPLSAAEATRSGPSADAPPRPDRQSGTSEMKWTPTTEPWVTCEKNGMKCRCSGDVVDCRAATGKKPTTVKSR